MDSDLDLLSTKEVRNVVRQIKRCYRDDILRFPKTNARRRTMINWLKALDVRPFPVLPNDCVETIMIWCSYKTIQGCFCACKSFHSISNANNMGFWGRLCNKFSYGVVQSPKTLFISKLDWPLWFNERGATSTIIFHKWGSLNSIILPVSAAILNTLTPERIINVGMDQFGIVVVVAFTKVAQDNPNVYLYRVVWNKKGSRGGIS